MGKRMQDSTGRGWVAHCNADVVVMETGLGSAGSTTELGSVQPGSGTLLSFHTSLCARAQKHIPPGTY